jgi:hypothetical protein
MGDWKSLNLRNCSGSSRSNSKPWRSIDLPGPPDCPECSEREMRLFYMQAYVDPARADVPVGGVPGDGDVLLSV